MFINGNKLKELIWLILNNYFEWYNYFGIEEGLFNKCFIYLYGVKKYLIFFD